MRPETSHLGHGSFAGMITMTRMMRLGGLALPNGKTIILILPQPSVISGAMKLTMGLLGPEKVASRRKGKSLRCCCYENHLS